METKIKTCINSEIGKLGTVIIHKPGSEVENMTPANAQRALYSDILNLSIASSEYRQLYHILNKVSQTIEIQDLLTDILHFDYVKDNLVTAICRNEQITETIDFLNGQEPETLSRLLIEGVLLIRDNLTRYLSEERFLLRPLHNLFFTRDAAMGMNDDMLIGKMANPVRERETFIMDAIFRSHPLFDTNVVNPGQIIEGQQQTGKITIEGGDFLIARKDILIVGTGIRTSTYGIDFLIDYMKKRREPVTIFVQELPSSPESFIHLDMVFTLLDQGTCMAYAPVIFESNRYRTIEIRIKGGKVSHIREVPDITTGLKKCGMDLRIIYCGGEKDLWIQEREQWHSGANFFAFAPGKLIGYKRNVYTLEELNKIGFEIIDAEKIIQGSVSPDDYAKCVVAIPGAELARGGGGARCMTMPVCRAEVDW